MYERTLYFSRRFIRNGFAVLALLLLFYLDNPTNYLVLSLVSLIGLLHLGIGFYFRNKLKNKSQENEDPFSTDRSKTFRVIDTLFSLLLFFSILFSLQFKKDLTLLFIILIAGYGGWITFQIIKIHRYLNA